MDRGPVPRDTEPEFVIFLRAERNLTNLIATTRSYISITQPAGKVLYNEVHAPGGGIL